VKFKPHRPENAIVRVSFVCEFADPLEDQGLLKLYGLHSQFAEKFPKPSINHGHNIRIGGGIAQPQVVPGIVSVAFEEYGRSGELAQGFHALPAMLSYINQRYTRWEEVWSQAQPILVAALSAVPDVRIQAFGLEYVDRFTAPTAEGPLDVTGLLNQNSEFLVPRVFQIPGLWHSHHGSLQDDGSLPCLHSKNDNINVDLVRESGAVEQFAVNMMLRHRRILPQSIPAGESLDLLNNFMDEVHNADKMVILDLLTDAAAREISLGETHAPN